MKLLQSIILTLLTVLLTLPVSAQDFEYGGIWYTVIDSDAKTVRTKEGHVEEGDVKIPANNCVGQLIIPEKVYFGDQEYTVTEIGYTSFALSLELTNVILPPSIIKVSQDGFYGCTGLTEIIFSDGLDKIGQGAFFGCTGLTTLDFPDTLKSIGVYSFCGCTNLTDINWSKSLETLALGAFGGCEKLRNVTLYSSICWIDGGVFGGCTGITSVTYYTGIPISSYDDTFPDVVYENATLKMPDTPLDRIMAISPWNRFSHIQASIEFEYEGIAYVVIDEEERTCKTRCGGLMSDLVLVPGNYVEGELVIPAFVSDGDKEYKVIGIGSFGFCNCEELTSVSLPETLTFIENFAFYGCVNIKDKELNLPESLVSIGETAFLGWLPLENVYLPPNIKLIGVTAFWGLENLETITYAASSPVAANKAIFEDFTYDRVALNTPNATLAEVQSTTPWNQFRRIKARDAVVGRLSAGEDFKFEGLWYTVLDTDAKTCKTMNGGNCQYNESELIIPSRVSDGLDDYTVIAIGSYGFAGCSWIKSVTFPETLVSIGEEAFRYCEGLSSLNLPESLSQIGTSAFGECRGLTSLKLPESLTTISESAFANCSNLQTVIFPETLTTIDVWAFTGCQSLTSLTLPEALKCIDFYAFGNCSDLISLKLPASLENIYYDAFGGCHNLETITYYASLPIDLYEQIFEESVFENATLYMPNALLSSVNAASPWNRFVNIEAKSGLSTGDDFEYEGTWYTVLDPEAKTVKTKEGHVEEGDVKIPANNCVGQLVIPETVYYDDNAYTVTEIGYTSFARNLQLTNVILPPSITRVSQDGFYGCPELTDIRFSDNLDYIGQGAFYNCEKLESVSLPASLQTMDWAAFIGCRNISTVNYYASEPVPMDGGSFDDETYWTATLNTPNASLADIQSMEPWNRFRHINAKDGSAVPVLNPGEDFEYQGLVYTVLDSEARTVQTKAGYRTGGDYGRRVGGEPETEGMKRTGHFGVTGNTIPGNYCEGEIEIPSIVSDGRVEYTVVGIGTDGFHDCVNLTSVKFPETLEFIGEASFEDAGLTSLNLPNSLKEIVHSAFISCDSIKTIVFPESLKKIGSRAFYGCNGIESLSFPKGIEEIEWAVFDSCYNVKNIIYEAERPIWTDYVFTGEVYENATLNMPNASLADIRNTYCWSEFRHIIARDGSTGFINEGDDFEYQGIWYTIIDPEERTARTKEGGNDAAGDVVIPETAYDGDIAYTVNAIGEDSFRGSDGLLSISLPSTIGSIGRNAFADCERLTSLVWTRHERISERSVEEIGNPNLLLYVDSVQFAPEGMTANVVADGVCESLVLTPGRAFTPVREFTALESRMVKEFRQRTWIGNAAGWETIVLPFDATEVYAENLDAYMTPFSLVTDVRREHPYWLSRADAYGEWSDAYGIEAGIPYIISMPNNPGYVDGYNVDGPVIFSNSQAQRITPATTAPYAVTWMSGREFRSLWLPLDGAEASRAMGLNVGMSDLRDDAGEFLAPGSAFHADIVPKPLEAYVTRLDGERAMRVIGNQSGVAEAAGGSGLEIRVEEGVMYVRSDSGRTIHVFTPDGAAVRTVSLKAGRTEAIEGLTPGIYLVEGRKIIVRN